MTDTKPERLGMEEREAVLKLVEDSSIGKYNTLTAAIRRRGEENK